jgi:hypothetical protein
LPGLEADDDENLQKYLDRSYWEERNKADEVSSFSQESHPVASPEQVENGENNASSAVQGQEMKEFVLQSGETEDEKKQKEQKAKFLKNLSASLDIFANRMRANQGSFSPRSLLNCFQLEENQSQAIQQFKHSSNKFQIYSQLYCRTWLKQKSGEATGSS